MTVTAHSINQLLPQTQCQECGFSGCLPYAEALAQGQAELNLCAAGGEVVMLDLAHLLQREPRAPEKIQPKALAWIDEAVCIGCTACIRACPVDAIMGASKWMHTVLADECTGCGLCLPPCPVDCIYLHDVADDFLPRNRVLASEAMSPRFQAAAHAQTRYEQRNARKQRENEARRAKLAEREAASKQQFAATASATAFNPADLIAQAMAKAQAQQNQRVVPNNREDFQKIQIQKAQEKATYSRAMVKMRYGNDEEKAAALQWLREYKAAQQAEKE